MLSEAKRIRPAARLISTIGEDLIGDVYSAIVELVKNSYDADASEINITFSYEKEALKIEIQDNGHGMSRDVVLNAWLVPATRDKLNKAKSPKGRLFQGKKGIGRYAAAILGQELVLKTTDQNGEETEVLVNWELFDEKEYLDDVEVIVSTSQTKNSSGTILFIKAINDKFRQWGKPELASLTNELRKLKSPLTYHTTEEFNINLAFINSPYEEYNNQIFEIEAFPIIELFDYRIFGVISSTGLVTAKYENNADENVIHQSIELQIKLDGSKAYCGPVEFDLRVFDRDSEAIGNLIDKGLIDPVSRLAIGKRDAKRMLDEVYGVNIYREGFRIRPYGNGGIDWLNLDRDRIQNPSIRISNNQIVGFVNIKPETISHLIEKSGRDGLKENSYYFGLVSGIRVALSELEDRRFSYRQKTGKGRQSKSIKNDLDTLFDYSALSSEVSRKLGHLKIDEKTISEVALLIHKDAERKSKLLENIQNTIAIYQGQATLGKIVTVLLHEGRKSVHYFRQQSPNLERWLRYYKAQGKWDDELYDDMLDRLKNFKQQSDLLAELFRRLDPLAKQNKGNKIDFEIKKSILKSKKIFETQLEEQNISFELFCNDHIILNGWEEDLIIALTNLIENSIYWIVQREIGDKKIIIEVIEEKQDLIIHYKDTGLGISRDNIESGAIFEPGFSKKINGTGLGLPIAGEAIERLNGSILAHHNEGGVYFTIEIRK